MLKFLLYLMCGLATLLFGISLFAGIAGLLLSIGVVKIAADIFAIILTIALFIGCFIAYILAP